LSEDNTKTITDFIPTYVTPEYYLNERFLIGKAPGMNIFLAKLPECDFLKCEVIPPILN
jgi:hypothetical protein